MCVYVGTVQLTEDICYGMFIEWEMEYVTFTGSETTKDQGELEQHITPVILHRLIFSLSSITHQDLMYL